MGVIRKVGKAWYIDYRVHGKRIRKAIGPSEQIAELVLKGVGAHIAKGRTASSESSHTYFLKRLRRPC